MYLQREIPEAFKQQFEAIRLLADVLYSKIKTREITEDIELFRCPQTMVRALHDLFPSFEVWDGLVSRFGKVTNMKEYGAKGFFHYEATARYAVSGQFRPIVHTILGFKEEGQSDTSKVNLPPLAIDVLPFGSVVGLAFPIPVCLDENCLPFVRFPLAPYAEMLQEKEEVLARNVTRILPTLKGITVENCKVV